MIVLLGYISDFCSLKSDTVSNRYCLYITSLQSHNRGIFCFHQCDFTLFTSEK